MFPTERLRKKTEKIEGNTTGPCFFQTRSTLKKKRVGRWIRELHQACRNLWDLKIPEGLMCLMAVQPNKQNRQTQHTLYRFRVLFSGYENLRGEILSPGWGLGMSNITKDFVGASQKPCAELWALSLQVFQSYSLLTSYNDVVMSPYLLDVG